MIDGIRVAPRVFLSDGGANLIENVESLRMVYITLQANTTSIKHETEFIAF